VRRKLHLTLAALLISLIGFASAQGTLNLATGEDWETLDPAFASGVQTGAMVAKLYDGLMRYAYDSTDVVPNLAASVDVNDDATVFTFTLNEGVTFHDGSPLTAADVKYSIERVVNPETDSPLTWVFEDAGIVGTDEFVTRAADGISGIEVLDDLTVSITLRAPYAMFLHHLAMPAAHIVSQAVTSALPAGEDLSNNPIGTGPFKLADRLRDSSLSLVANADYHGGAPHIAGVNYRIITEDLIRWNEYLAGNLDSSGIPSSLFLDVVNDPQYADQIVTTNELAVFYWALNQRIPELQDVRVRRAIAMAIDRQAIIDGPYNGTDQLANGPIPPGLAGYDDTIVGIPYDPEGARALLAEAGYPDGFDLEIWSTRAETTVAVSELIQFFLSEVGITSTINQVDFGVLIDGAINGRAPAFYLSWFADYADAYNFLHPLFVASGANRYGYTNDRVTELMAEAATVANLEDRVPLYEEAQRLIVEDVPVVFMRYPVSYEVVRPGVTGLLNHPIFNADKFTQVQLP
jgi:peptide/nickel transport system substrate-binding protein/oligopeptide transport system substrate-binding protein